MLPVVLSPGTGLGSDGSYFQRGLGLRSPGVEVGFGSAASFEDWRMRIDKL
jgi:hypothetical protein